VKLYYQIVARKIGICQLYYLSSVSQRKRSRRIKTIGQAVLRIIEPLILLLAIYFFWYPSRFPAPSLPDGIDRADYVWLLALLLPVMAARWALQGRLWTTTPLDGWLLAFVALGIINVYTAPYESRGLLMLARPLLGMALLLYLVELARTTGSLDLPLAAGLVLALLVGLLALGGTQWPGKAEAFDFITEQLPRVRPFFAPGGFNPNEIAGALAWLAPLAAGLAVYPWRRWRRGFQALAGITALLLVTMLMLGQSRSAIIGVLAALLVVILLAFPAKRERYVVLGVVIALMILQVSILLGMFANRQAGVSPVSSPNLTTLHQRFAIWESAQAMIANHPLTGVGMDRFRYGPVTAAYPIRGIERTMPHAHNEFFQIATDLGLPGLVIFSAWNLTTAYMLMACWRRGDRRARVAAVAVGGGLLAHLIYGITDAIPLWDRFSFVYWVMLGLAGGQYVLTCRETRTACE
jgi:putative inorganic carbon (hco3(-)) transporter